MKRIILWISPILILFFIPRGGLASTSIVAQNCTEAQFSFNATLKNTLLSQAVLKEALSLLPYNLSPLQREMLYFFIKKSPMKYILSYKELEYKDKNIPMLKIDVTTNTSVVKGLLKDMGIYFNKGTTFFSLISQGLEDKDKVELFNLETLSNMVEDPREESLKMEIKKIDKGLYSGSLVYEKYRWFYTATSLDRLWENLWKNYFSLPEIKEQYYTVIRLWAHGWLTTVGLKFFQEKLRQRAKIVDEIRLISLQMKEDIGGEWKIYTLRPSLLISYLSNYFLSREMEFQITTLSSPSTAQ